MKCIISEEWYPVYEVEEREPYDWEGSAWQFDVPDETLTRIKAAFAEFDAVQQILKSLLEPVAS